MLCITQCGLEIFAVIGNDLSQTGERGQEAGCQEQLHSEGNP